MGKNKAPKKNRPTAKSHPARGTKELAGLALGESHTTYPNGYSPALLEKFPNRHPDKLAWTSFVCTEFTSLCPKTGQPDFARIYINYVAEKWMVESKSCKLYLFGFRNHGDFHEDCVQTICNDLAELLKPYYLEVAGEFTPRGGIAIWPYAQYANHDKKWQKLKEERFENYAPGKYTLPLSRVYG